MEENTIISPQGVPNPFDDITDDDIADDGTFKSWVNSWAGKPIEPIEMSDVMPSVKPSNNPYDYIANDGSLTSEDLFPADFRKIRFPTETSALGSFFSHAGVNTVPAATGLVGTGGGAWLGAGLGTAIEPGIGTAIGAFLGGLVGGYGGASAGAYIQDRTLKEVAPDWTDALYQQMEDQEKQHPIASFIAGMAPYLITMSPTGLERALPANATAWQRLAANPKTARVFSGALQGGMQLGTEYVEGKDPDWVKAAIATGFGTIFARPNALGTRISRIGEGVFTGDFGTETVRETLRGRELPADASINPTLAEVDDANVMGFGVTEQVFTGDQERDPDTAAVARKNVLAEKFLANPAPVPQDIHEVASSINPSLINHWDDLNQQVWDLRHWLLEQNEPSEQTIRDLAKRKEEMVAEIAATKNKAEQRRLRTILRTEVQNRIDQIDRRAAAHKSGEPVGDTPEMTQARLKIVELQNQISQLAPERNALMRLAAERGRAKTVSPAFSDAEDALGVLPENSVSAVQGRSIAQQRAFIEEDLKKRLMQAGRPEDEALASSKLVAAHYATRAARMKGALGAADDLYRSEGPDIRSASKSAATQKKLGSIRLAADSKPIIRLFQNADASTFLHEIGHQWLEELARDAVHEMATDDVKADWQTVRDWIATRDGARITRAQHEKFARGFEQYMRSGIAPSEELVGVFAQFRNWLLTIYRSIADLGREIDPRIREVYDRLLAIAGDDTFIVPDKEPVQAMSDHHLAAAATPARHLATAIADIKSDINDRILTLPEDVQNELARAATKTGFNGSPESGAGQDTDGSVAADVNGYIDIGEGDARSPGYQPVLGSDSESGRESLAASGAGGNAREDNKPAYPLRSSVVLRSATSPVPAPRPAETISGAGSRFIDKAGNIRLDNIRSLVSAAATNGDVSLENMKQVFRDIAGENDDFLANRRGIVSDGDALNAARSLIGDDPTPLFRKRIGEAFSNSEVIGLQMLSAQSARNVAELARLASTGSEDDVAKYIKAREFHGVLQARYSQATAEAGRALRALRKIDQLWTPEATAANSALKRAMAANANNAPQEKARLLYQARIEAKLVAQMDRPEQVAKFINERRSSPGDMLVEYWTAGLLSGFSTQSAVLLSNSILTAMRAIPETLLAAATGRVREAMGRQEIGIQAGEAAARLQGIRQAAPTALREAALTLKTGGAVTLPGENTKDTAYHNPLTARQLQEGVTFEQARAEAFGLIQGIRDGFIAGSKLLDAAGIQDAPFLASAQTGEGHIPNLRIGNTYLPVGTVARLPFRANAAQDSFFRVINYSMEKSAEAFRIAVREGLEGDALTRRVAELWRKPTPEMMEKASQEATVLTMMGQAGEFTQRLQRLVNYQFDLPGLGKTRLLKFINPFVRMASVSLDATLMERSPVGLLRPQIRDDIMGRNGAIAQDLATGRMVFGVAVLLAGMGLAAQNYISGAAPTDPRERAVWMLAGNRAHSIRIGNFWYGLNRLGPHGVLLGMAADLWRVAESAEEEDFDKAAAMVWAAVSENVLEQSWMTGFSDALRATTDSGRYGEAYIQKFVSSFVPYSVGMGQLARMVDPQTRVTRTVLDAILAKIPFASQDLPPRRDIFGEVLPTPGMMPPPLNAIYMSKINNDPVLKALMDGEYFPGPAAKIVNGLRLTPKEYDNFAKISGHMSKQRLDVLVRSWLFKSASPEEKHDLLRENVRQAREIARSEIVRRYPRLGIQAYHHKMH